MARQRVTLEDVARRAGVSTTTVSFVLSGRTDMRISVATSDRVRESARVLDYVPRTFATRPDQLPLIGFISDRVATHHFAGEMLRGGITAAAEHRFGVITAETAGESHLEDGLLTDLIARGIDQFVYSVMATQTVEVPAELKVRRTVLVNCVDPTAGLPTILPDEYGAGRLAAETLMSAGHDDAIWLVGEVNSGVFAALERLAGLSETMAARGLSLARQVRCRWWPPEARAAVGAVLATTDAADLPTAMIAINDRVAMGIYQAVHAAGLRIPDDLSVLSFDNSDLAWWLSPELTSVGIPYFEMGRRAVECLLTGTRAAVLERLPMPLHDRSSVAAPAARRSLRQTAGEQSD